MDVLVLIDKLDDLVHGASTFPMTDKVMIDRDEIYDLLDQMRATIPEEIKQARWIVKERQEMLQEAKEESERILREAREEAQRLASEQEVVRRAQRQSEDIIRDAEAREREIRLGAEDYADEILKTLETNLDKFLAAVQRGRERLQTGGSRARKPERPGRWLTSCGLHRSHVARPCRSRPPRRESGTSASTPSSSSPSCWVEPTTDVLVPDGVHVDRRPGRRGLPGERRRSTPRSTGPAPAAWARPSSRSHAEQQEFAPTAKDGWEETELSEFIKDLVVDVDGLAREALVLALPAQVVCSETCKGLCAHCGADLNQGAVRLRRRGDRRALEPAQGSDARGARLLGPDEAERLEISRPMGYKLSVSPSVKREAD